MSLQFRFRRPLSRRTYLTVGRRGPRLGVRAGRLTASFGVTGVALGLRLLKGVWGTWR